MSPAGSSARPASACVMVWRLKPSWREASAAMACSAARRVGGMSAAEEIVVASCGRAAGGIAEGELVDGGEVAGLRADAGRMCAGNCSGQRQEATDDAAGPSWIRWDHGA